MASLEAEFKKLSLAGKSAVELSSLTNEKSSAKKEKGSSDTDIYYLQIHQFNGGCVDGVADGRVAVLCSTHHVRIFNAETLVRESTIDGSDAQVTTVAFGHNSPDLVYTSSVDSEIRCWDLRLDLTKPVNVFKASENKAHAFLSFDLTYNDRFMCAGTKLKKEDAMLYFWDHRQSESMGCYEDMHSDDITQVKFHPSRQDSLLTASDDGLVNYLDISGSTEEDAIQYTFDTASTPDKLSWIGEEEAFISTYANTAYIWDVSSGDEKVKSDLPQFQEASKSTQVEYLVDCFVDSKHSPVVLAGNSRCDGVLFNLTSPPSYIGFLPASHSQWIRACTYNIKSQSLYTVGEDALLCCWKPSSLIPPSPGKSRSLKAGHRVKPAVKKPYDR
ncbi:WD repeat-containing protein 89-like [Watersipora subatra]|uniref:WD repeat-containing protein 89-like n=1 Tax=Watersipora subatra TaxID=2589382 RepID=UPI00355BB4F8